VRKSSALSCRFGETLAPAVWLSSKEAACRAPELLPGPHDLALTINGYDWAVAPTPFSSFLTPIPTALRPSSGPTSGGARVTVSGYRFPGEGQAMWCRFGVVTVPAQRSVSPSGWVVCMSPPGPAGNVTLELSVNSLDFTEAALRFAYSPNPHTLSPRPQTINPAPYNLHPRPYSINPKPQSINPKLETLNPTPGTAPPHWLSLNSPHPMDQVASMAPILRAAGS